MIFSDFAENVLTRGPGDDKRFCFILGAGASKESGIPTGAELATSWYGELADRSRRDSPEWNEWFPMVKMETTDENRKMAISSLIANHSLLSRVLKPADDAHCRCLEDFIRIKYVNGITNSYGILAQELFAGSSARDAYFENLMSGKEPSRGYEDLARILIGTEHNIAITTNFDTLIESAFFKVGGVLPIEVKGPKDDLSRICDRKRWRDLVSNYPPTRCALIKVHSDISSGFLLNTPEETCYLPDEFAVMIHNVLKEYVPIVIGYSGGDIAFMQLLLRYAKGYDLSSPGLYWFVHGDEEASVPEEVDRLVRIMRGSLIRYDGGFNRLMKEVGYRLRSNTATVSDESQENIKGEKRAKEEDLHEDRDDKKNDTSSYEDYFISRRKYGLFGETSRDPDFRIEAW